MSVTDNFVGMLLRADEQPGNCRSGYQCRFEAEANWHQIGWNSRSQARAATGFDLYYAAEEELDHDQFV